MNPHRIKQLRTYGSILLVTGLLGYIGYGLWYNWGKIRDYTWDINPFLFIFSITSISLCYVLFVILWKWLLSMMGQPISFRSSYKIWFLSQSGKYLPGKVWSAVGRVFLMHNAGMGRLFSGLNILYEIILMMLGGLILVVITLPFWKGETELIPSYMVLFSIITLCILLHPRIADFLINFGLQYTKRGINEWRSSLRYKQILLLLISYVALWGFIGLSFFLFFSSIHHVPIEQFPLLAGIFVFSWIAGNLAFLAPAGIGVREGVMIYLLGKFYPSEVALVSTIGARMWITGVEMTGIGIGLLLRKVEDK